LFDNFDLMIAALGAGAWTTVWVTLTSFAIALIIGMILVVMHVSPALPARWAANAYTQLFRNVPLLAVLFIMFFGLPSIGIVADSWVWALLGLGMYTGAFVGETLRSGINSIPLGQAEAARSIGLTFSQSLGGVILPQAIRAVRTDRPVAAAHRGQREPFRPLGGHHRRDRQLPADRLRPQLPGAVRRTTHRLRPMRAGDS
jgi:glutamate transport system permease protein